MMCDLGILALTIALTWGMWRVLETWGAMAAYWAWAWGMWFAREMRAI